MTKHPSVAAYVAAAPPPVRAMLKQLRAIVRALAPKAEEKISYGMPGYKLHGRPLVYFAAFKGHIGFYPMSGTFLKAYAPSLRAYKTSAGTVRFPIGKPLPVALIKKLVKGKMKINETHA